MPRLWRSLSLRGKLVVACVAVQALAAGLMVWSTRSLLQDTLLAQARAETLQVVALLEQAIAAPLAQRDYATLQQTLDLVRRDATIDYLVLRDHRGEVVAATGWDTSRPLPPRDGQTIDLERADTTLHVAVPVSLAGQPLGGADLGLGTERLREARAEFMRRSAVVGSAAMVASMLALALIAFAVTRHLSQLTRAAQRVAEGDYDVHVRVTARDEIGRLGTHFNAMAAALKQRVAALQLSEKQQRAHLATARAEQSRLAALLGAMDCGIIFVDVDGKVIYANEAFLRTWSLPGLAPEQRVAELVPLMQAQTEHDTAPALAALRQPRPARDATPVELHLRDGRTVVQRMQPVGEASKVRGWIWLHDDVTQQRATQQRAHQAMLDPLTRLLNRRGLYEALAPAIEAAAAQSRPLALLFIDLDDFKYANDLAGHRMGDEILATVAHTLADQARDGQLVARIGGDEFAVLCPGVGAEDGGEIAARIVQAVTALQFLADGQPLRVGCSVGLATYPADALDDATLLARADAAMYQAKQGGKNGWAAYRNDPARDEAESVRMNWNVRIHRALQAQRFVLHFQPVLRATDLRLSHHEALLRMVDESDEGTLIPPLEFVPHAERSGKIRQIDRWVFEQCIERLAQTAADVHIAVNLSARTLEDSGFPGFLRASLQRHDVDPRRLHIELTETFAIPDPLAARQRIDVLRGLGCSVHLDDFGSGFSSFSHLKLLQVDAVKIDGGFIRDLNVDPANRLFVASMIDIAHLRGKSVVAEHVEDQATLDVLRRLGVDLVQGYHLGRPSARLVEPSRRPQLEVVSNSRSAPLGPH